jgi:two-component system, cell cycle sensor histidine kinase and response regulator CckA
MSEEIQTHLFEPFFSTKEANKGTGLGLATVYGIVQQTAGHIRVDSELGRGTAFRIFLPKTQAKNGEQKPAAPKALPRGDETILLVKERSDLRVAAAETLRDLGYTVLEADGPLRAMEMGGDQTQGIDLLLSGVAPQGMPGHVLLDMIRTSRPEIKILFLTEDVSSPIVEEAGEPGLDYLPEPFSLSALARKVREVLDRA